jgi:hypothetical protein
MSLPEYIVSSPIVNVDVSTLTSKIVFLPPASTVIGQSFTIRDSTGAVFNPSIMPTRYIYVSTIGVDLFNNTTNSITFSIPYQSLRVIAQNTSNYAVIQNDLQGHFWLDS